jgi:hypothetical protein
MALDNYYTDGGSSKREKVGTGLPVISQGLDSVRTYQWEMHFQGVPGSDSTLQHDLVLACKQLTSVGFTIEPIEVHRVNDKVFYPGKGQTEELTATFDNLYQPQVAASLWRWYSRIYNPLTGRFLGELGEFDPSKKKANFKAIVCTILQLDAQGQPQAETRLYGVMPISWKTAEFNYGTNEFHTIEMVFRYDFMEQTDKTGMKKVPSPVNAAI